MPEQAALNLQQEIPNQSTWARVVFGDVVENVNDYFNRGVDSATRYIAGEHVDEGDLKIRRWGMTDDGFFPPTFKRKFRNGDVLFHSRNIKKLAVPDFDGVTGEKLFVLRTKYEKVLSQEFLGYLLSGEDFARYAAENWSGSVNKFFNWGALSKYEFFLPPLHEQLRVVKGLVAAQNNAESLLKLKDATRVVQVAAFEEMLGRKDARLRKLGSLMTAPPRNGFSPVAASSETGYWVLALSAITKSGYRPGQLKPVDPGPETEAARIQLGDLVVSRSNTRDLVGLPMVFPEGRDDVSYPDTMTRISVDPDEVSTEYLELCLRLPSCRRQVQSYAAGTSSSMLKINGSNLKKVEVPLVDRKDQDSILKAVNKFSEMLRVAEKRIDSAQALQFQLVDETTRYKES
ncbi:hypothetical protein [Cobetia sp. Ld8]|uniref:restriction endonuclease subunit S n=1 Tax=Cobetia sp. Ld8 TaxID=649154 RepID=UPI0038647A97